MSKKKVTIQDSPVWTPDEPYRATGNIPPKYPSYVSLETAEGRTAYFTPAYCRQRILQANMLQALPGMKNCPYLMADALIKHFSGICGLFQQNPGESDRPRGNVTKGLEGFMRFCTDFQLQPGESESDPLHYAMLEWGQLRNITETLQPYPGESEHPLDHLPKAVRQMHMADQSPLRRLPKGTPESIYADLKCMGFAWASFEDVWLLCLISTAVALPTDKNPDSMLFNVHRRPNIPVRLWDSQTVRKVLRDFMLEHPNEMQRILERYQTSTSSYARGIVQICLEESLFSLKHSR